MSGRQNLQGHVTSEMAAAPLVGRVQSNLELTITVGLVVDSDAMMDTATRISTPQSASFRQYMTPEEIADAFGASQSDYQSLLDWGHSHDLRPAPQRNRFVATFAGSVANIERALNVQLNNKLRPDGTKFFGPDREPSLDFLLPVEHIGGLDNYRLPTRAGGSGVDGEYQGSDFRNAYAAGSTLTGEGQSIGIFMLDGFSQSDINQYATLLNQTFLPIQEVPAGTVTVPNGEGTLDISMALAMAPAAQVIVFLGTTTQILTEMTGRPDVKQFSSSWFWYNGTTTDLNLMATLAMQGQSFFQASGDAGAYGPDWPASAYASGSYDCRQFPFITIVGGTDLHMTDHGTDYGRRETAWSDSSGGWLANEPIPWYQIPFVGSNGASSSNRNAPDVSAQANGGTIIFGGASQYINGTSQATPLWAGFMALVNQNAAQKDGRSVGFANPALYAIAQTNAYHTMFHDVVSGSNPNSHAVSYSAGPGYDLVTGLGSPKAALIDALMPMQFNVPPLNNRFGGLDPTVVLVGAGGITEVFTGLGDGGPIVEHQE